MVEARLWLDGWIEVGSCRLPFRPTLALLDALADQRSVRGAADCLNVSYRSAWGRVSALEKACGRQLVAKTKGHGSVLTPAGLALRAALRPPHDGLAASLAEEARLLRARLQAIAAPETAICQIAASHDPVLVDLLASMSNVELAVVGSTEAVHRLMSRRVAAAGFHLGPATDRALSGPANLMEDPAFDVVPLFRREQGLMLPAGNPLAITSMKDLARPDVVFVNRQKGSGTRAWTDHLLAESAVRPQAVRGYGMEEFTHGAVAATVASGMANAGLGVRVAAERFRLGFLPLAEETYYLASRSDEVHPAVTAIVEHFRPAGGDPPRGAAG